MTINKPDWVPVPDDDMKLFQHLSAEVLTDRLDRRIALEIPQVWIEMKVFIARAMATRGSHSVEGADWDAQATKEIHTTLEDALYDELQALLMGIHTCQHPQTAPESQVAEPDPEDDDIPFRDWMKNSSKLSLNITKKQSYRQ